MPNEYRRRKPQILTDLVRVLNDQESKELPLELQEAEVIDQLEGSHISPLFLGRFTADQVLKILEQFEILSEIYKKGYSDIRLKMTARSKCESYLGLFDGDPAENRLLFEMVINEGSFKPKPGLLIAGMFPRMELLFIEWLLMQDIRRPFSPDKPRLPGQNHPGLGVSRKVVNFLTDLAQKMGKDGILNHPEYLHNALFYAIRFMFIDPEKQGEIMAIRRALLSRYSLSEVSFASYFNAIYDKDSKEMIVWRPTEQICPISPKLRSYFESVDYKSEVLSRANELQLAIDEEVLMKKMKTADAIIW